MKRSVTIALLVLIGCGGFLFSEENRTVRAKEQVDVDSVKAHRGRAWLENGITLLISSINYWSKYAKFIADWQYELTWKDQRRRFFTLEAIRLDSNNYYLNWGHGLAGMAYYDYFRSNRLSVAESALWTNVSSLWWEFCTEWREIISINDLVFTGIGGPALGETLVQIARYCSSRPGWGYRFLEASLNWIWGFNEILDGRFGRWAAYLPAGGDYGMRFFLGLKDSPVSTGVRKRGQLEVGLNFRFLPVPEYGQIGSVRKFQRQTMSVRFNFDLASSRAGVEEYRFNTRVIWAGYFAQELAEGKAGSPRGWQFMAGFGSGYDFFRKRSVAFYDSNDNGSKDPHYAVPRPTDFRDKMAVVNMAGPMLSYTFFRPSWRLRATAEASLDFGMINALALNKYSVDHETEHGKTTVMAWGYYYGLGFTLSGGLDFQSGSFSLSSDLSWQRYGSIEGGDRFANLVTGDFHISDRRTLLRVQLGWRPGRLPIELAAVYEGIDRWGRIRPVEVRDHEERFFYRIIFIL